MKDVRCTACRAEFTLEEIEGATGCPTCGSKGIPMHIASDVTIKINVHELRILTIWASNYVQTVDRDGQMAKTLEGILYALRAQLPGVPLTLKDEFQQVADVTGQRVNVYKEDGTPKGTFEPKKPS